MAKSSCWEQEKVMWDKQITDQVIPQQNWQLWDCPVREKNTDFYLISCPLLLKISATQARAQSDAVPGMENTTSAAHQRDLRHLSKSQGSLKYS